MVTCNGGDLAGNREEKSFKITLQDNTAPAVQITKTDHNKDVEIAEVPLLQDCDQLSLLIFVQVTAIDNLALPHTCARTYLSPLSCNND